MYILFEEHQYESHLVEEVLKDIYVLQDVNAKVSVQYVGYFYNPHVKDCVFILPKVLLIDNKSLKAEGDNAEELTEKEYLVGVTLPNGGHVTPEQIITPEGQKALSKEYRKFIYEFSVWIYRALSVFYKANPDSQAILYKRLPQAGKGRRGKANTYLDIVLSLIRFNQENRDFVLFTIKNLHRGHNKINWTRTIAHSQGIVQDGDGVVYLNPVNKKRLVNYEEELFVIYYSILNYLNDEYGFHTPINIQYDLITGKQFKQYLSGLGKTRLRQIKYKYFSDKALLLWDLCFAFFENSHHIAINTHAQEYLLAKSFHVVFEAMIDELIGTPHNKIPKGLADQADGKRVDHLYTDLALTSPDGQSREVYYIGDSKYYKSGHDLTSESIYKQYTYARNVVQWNVNLFASDDPRFNEDEKAQRKEDKNGRFGGIHLQDNSLTEGYDIIPNFFISATVQNDCKYDDGKKNIKKHNENDKHRGDEKHCTKISYQFPDRLFDRDTLFLSQYDVNFLYVLFLYARNRASEKAHWKQEVRRIFREEIREVVQDKFQIYAMRAKQGVDGELYLKQHFYELNGRVYQPYGEERSVYFAYARPKDNMSGTQAQYNELEQYFHIERCDMGVDPQKVLQPHVEAELSKTIATPQWLTMRYLERYTGKGILVGYYRDEKHLQWILGNNDKGTLVYNVRLKTQGDKEPRDGAHTENFYRERKIQFVILYTKDVEQTGEYRVFHVKDMAKVTEKRMHDTWYPSEEKGDYFFFRFDEEVNIGKLDFCELLKKLRVEHLETFGEYVEGTPLFTTAEEIVRNNYRVGF